MDDRIWYLKNCDLFERLSADEIARLESVSRARSLTRGEVIYLPTDASGSVLLLASGRVKLYHITREGKQAVMALIDPGEVFGELAVFDSGRRDEFAEAMEPGSVVMIPQEEVQRLMGTHPQVMMSVTRLMGLRRKRYERRLKSLLFRSNRERLAALLLELAEKYGRREADGVALGVKLSHQDLAGIIGCTRETVTVNLRELQEDGLVIVRRRRLILTRPAELAAELGVAPPELPQSSPPNRPARAAISGERPA